MKSLKTKIIVVLTLFLLFIGLITVLTSSSVQNEQSLLPAAAEQVNYAKKTYRKVIVIKTKSENLPNQITPVMTPFIYEVTPNSSPAIPTINLNPSPTIAVRNNQTITVAVTKTPVPPPSGFIKPSLIVLLIAGLFIFFGFVW